MDEKRLGNVPVIGGLVTRFSLGFRELVLIGILIVTGLMFVIFAGMYGTTKKSEERAQVQALKGDQMDKTCFSKLCLESTAYTLSSMNISAKPCDDFYNYACGNYKMFHPLDADYPSHTFLSDMLEKNEDKLKTLLEKSVKRNTDWASERKLKHLFQSCMDDFSLERLKGRPFITQVLSQLGGWSVLGTWFASNWNLNEMLKKVQTDFWVDAMYAPRVAVDYTNPTQTSIEIYPAGTSRHMYWYYYVSSYATQIQNDYKKFIGRVANLMVRDSNIVLDATTQRDRVAEFVNDAFTMETNIARLAINSPWKSYSYAFSNRMTLNELTQAAGGQIDYLQQSAYLFSSAGITGHKETLVYSLDYLKGLDNMIKNLPSGNQARMVHNYLIWRVMEAYVTDLSVDYVHANREVLFDTTGTTEFPARWTYCFSYVKQVMPEALGQLYIADHFVDKNKAKVTEITETTKQALADLLKKTPWMDAATRAKAEAKINSASYKIGYSDLLKSTDKIDVMYQPININVSDFFGNILSMNNFHKLAWNKELVNGEDRDQWYFSTFDTNMAVLWYWNEVIVPAGLLQFPIYDYHLPHYFTFGSFGTILGHFVVHLVDEYGKNWDSTGTYLGSQFSWWSNATLTSYGDVKSCMIDAYNTTQGPFIQPDGKQVYFPIHSARTATDNIAQVTGVRLAYNAYQKWEATHGVEKLAPSGQGFTNEQLFFISYAQTYCFNRDSSLAYRQARYTSRIREDYKVNLAVSQLDEFNKAFKCSATSRLNPSNKCGLY
ncbi:endothelin-converting enzyme-like 1 [Haliotis rufescens]|uniref:endothelin-converting enzyme-like 1 n=1 Tax=Haliotis rufescens TaxID=6454 RepID=UPI001EAFC1F4|nr:endothelin-converting enzyme-like 1 [Haliotis rufescens]